MSEASGIPPWARVGAKVVCIKRSPWTAATGVYDGTEHAPTFGEVCTVTEVEQYGHGIYLALQGYDIDVDGTFSVCAFRPAVEPKSEVEDVALFRHHLTKRQPVAA